MGSPPITSSSSSDTTSTPISKTFSNPPTQPSPRAGVADPTSFSTSTELPTESTTFDYIQSDSSLRFDPPYNCSNVKDDLNGDLSYCCSLPRLSVSSDVYFECQKYCDSLQKYDDKCCMMSCCFRRTGIIVNKIFNVESLRQSMIYFVFGDTVWGDVINDSVDFCYNRAVSENIFMNNKLDCDAIPYHAYRVIDCVYARNYMNCPVIDWNLNELNFCDGTENYVEKCLEWP